MCSDGVSALTAPGSRKRSSWTTFRSVSRRVLVEVVEEDEPDEKLLVSSRHSYSFSQISLSRPSSIGVSFLPPATRTVACTLPPAATSWRSSRG